MLSLKFRLRISPSLLLSLVCSSLLALVAAPVTHAASAKLIEKIAAPTAPATSASSSSRSRRGRGLDSSLRATSERRSAESGAPMAPPLVVIELCDAPLRFEVRQSAVGCRLCRPSRNVPHCGGPQANGYRTAVQTN